MSPVPEEERDIPNHGNSEIESTDYPDVIINADSSEDDDDDDDEGDDDGYHGYQALSLNNDNDSGNEDDCFEAIDENVDEGAEGQQTTNIHVPDGIIQQVRLQQDGSVPTYMQFASVAVEKTSMDSSELVPAAPKPDKDDLLWNQPGETDISMETEHEERVRSVMAGFKLPSSNIPDWAKALTDDQWQVQVVSKLKETSQETGNKNFAIASELTVSKTECDRTDRNIPLNSRTGVPGPSPHSPD